MVVVIKGRLQLGVGAPAGWNTRGGGVWALSWHNWAGLAGQLVWTN